MIRDFSSADILLLLWSAKWTVALSLIAFVGGSLVGLFIALMRTSRSKTAQRLARAYISVFQGTPLLLQLFVVFFGADIFGLRLNAWTAVSLGLTLYSSAFLGEIWRGAIESVPQGQWEASRALGLNYFQQVWLVVLPQAMRVAIAPTVGFLVQVIKNTSLASILGFSELTRTGQFVNNATYEPLLVFSTVSAIYFAMCWPLSYVSRRLERRLAGQGERR